MKISIADFGIGNIKSVLRLFEHIGVEAEIANSPSQLSDIDKLILPGVGAFDAGMASLEAGGWLDVLNDLAFKKQIPILGLCLGMQLLCRGSEEGKRKGLGWIPADVIAFKLQGTKLKVPHMGWATVTPTQDNPILPMGLDEQRFYHTHKFHVVCDSEEFVFAKTEYGYPFASVIGYKNVFGVQFHPEKSHRYGMELLRRFSEL